MNKKLNLHNYTRSNSLISLLKKENDRLNNDLITQRIDVDKRVNDAQRLISTLKIALDSLDGGADILKKIESNTYIVFNKKMA